jgi:hypothetical protein
MSKKLQHGNLYSFTKVGCSEVISGFYSEERHHLTGVVSKRLFISECLHGVFYDLSDVNIIGKRL